jgi:hypothetical protein
MPIYFGNTPLPRSRPLSQLLIGKTQEGLGIGL